MAVIALVVAGVAPPSISTTALIGAIPIALGALAMGIFGIETRRRQLEDITAEELRLSPATGGPWALDRNPGEGSGD